MALPAVSYETQGKRTIMTQQRLLQQKAEQEVYDSTYGLPVIDRDSVAASWGRKITPHSFEGVASLHPPTPYGFRRPSLEDKTIARVEVIQGEVLMVEMF